MHERSSFKHLYTVSCPLQQTERANYESCSVGINTYQGPQFIQHSSLTFISPW